MKSSIQIFVILISAVFFSCEKKSGTDVNPDKPYSKGVVILNAGNFTDNNGTISFLLPDGWLSTNIFQQENLRDLAGSISGYAEVNNKGIILVDNSTAGKDQIEIVDAGTFKSIASIPSIEIENPRNVIKVSETKAYITAWDFTGDFSDFYKNEGYVAVLDLNTNKIVKKIKVQNGAESIMLYGKEVLVGNSGSSKGFLSVIDIDKDEKVSTIEVGVDPELIGVDANNKLWVYAAGGLVKLNAVTKSIEARVKINAIIAAKSPSSFKLSPDKKTIYFTYSFYDAADGYKQKGETYSFSVNDGSVSTTKPFVNKLFSGGLGVDPSNGNIYAGLIPSFKQAGYVFRYKPDGSLIDSLKAEIAPSKFFFKN